MASPQLSLEAAGPRGVILQTGSEAQGDLVICQESHRKAMSAQGIKPHCWAPTWLCAWAQLLTVPAAMVPAESAELRSCPWIFTRKEIKLKYLELVLQHTNLSSSIWVLTFPNKKRGPFKS